MRLFLFLAVLSMSVAAGGCFTQQAEGQKSPTPVPPAPTEPANRQPVLVELFTSEGCSSCPPADRNLKFLAEQQPVNSAQIIPLAFHVDYWDHLGWKDQFSSALFTRRQEVYVQRFGLDSSYTPEMVIDGDAEFIGNDTGRAVKVIAKAAASQKGSISASLDGDSISVSIDGLPKHNAATVFLAVTEDDITSSVKSGENAGETFHHSSIVRSLTSLGMVEKNAVDFQVRSNLPDVSSSKPENRSLVLFVQDNADRRILAVVRLAPRPS
ncbi:MAG TPA: DUF1223 domain-containing protein [Pyrinomonadaceae bacterium]|nr:DUF1223 domain-containing protein [Pyrinomonadaceae bacterium]